MITWETRILLTCDNTERGESHRDASYRQYAAVSQSEAIGKAREAGWTVELQGARCPECAKARQAK